MEVSAADGTPSIDPDLVELHWGVKIPLRDGVQLQATVYTPRGQAKAAPCLFTLTPYIAQSYHDRGMYFAAHGYPFLTIDVRGRGNSQGQFRPLIQEAHDGYDIVEWLAQQPYCNGRVAMWGGSYAGYDQWVTATQRPPHLATIVPAAAPYAGVDFPFSGGIFLTYDVQWLALVNGHAAQTNWFGDDAFWKGYFKRWLQSGEPFNGLGGVLGDAAPIFQEWVAHPEQDAYWDQYNPTAEQYAKLTLPILTITGSYDDDQPGALEHYRQYMRNASAAAKARHYLVLGPWDHAGTRTPTAQVGGLTFGAASLVDLPKLHLEWYAWTMQDGPKPAFLEKPVVYHTAPFETDTEVSGFFKLSAWLAIDQPDTDLQVQVYEIAADGSSVVLSSDLIRARYRQSLREPTLITTKGLCAAAHYRFNAAHIVTRTLIHESPPFQPFSVFVWPHKGAGFQGRDQFVARAEAS